MTIGSLNADFQFYRHKPYINGSISKKKVSLHNVHRTIGIKEDMSVVYIYASDYRVQHVISLSTENLNFMF